MTADDIITYVKNMMNEASASTSNWSNPELYQIIENKCNEAITTIGLIEGRDTGVTVISQADYPFPADYVRLRRLWYNGQPLKYLPFRMFESRRPTGTTNTGTPREYGIWQDIITLLPTPNAVGTLTYFGEKMQSTISSTNTTIRIPSLFHHAICDGVLGEMYPKDLNAGFANFYLSKWQNIHIPAMREYAKRRQRRGLSSTVTDADSALETELGVI